ncbi:hypothetical protein V5O48_015974 [Marasmius crinis-equi]|uniref:Uncharacterized protein n=1 Tax=Marasmius crinis-equi TaxID=585013 RepID=A0ABR3ET08_9AGAR
MDIVFSPAFFDSPPTVDRQMEALLANLESTDLCQVRRGQELLPGQKTVVWAKSAGSVQCRVPEVDPDVLGAIWVDARDLRLGGLSMEVILGEFTIARRRWLDRKFVLIVGVNSAREKDRLAPMTLSLMAHQRAIVRTCATAEEGLMQIYRWTLAINPYNMVLPDSRLASRKAECQYMAFLMMKLQGISVPQAKAVVTLFPCGRELYNGIKSRGQATVSSFGDMSGEILGRLEWLVEEYGQVLERMERDL